MKRFFLIPLLTMLCTVMAFAATHTASTADELNSAIAAASAGDVINVTKSFTWTVSGTIDCNGSNIKPATKITLTISPSGNSAKLKNGTIQPTDRVVKVSSGSITFEDFAIKTCALELTSCTVAFDGNNTVEKLKVTNNNVFLTNNASSTTKGRFYASNTYTANLTNNGTFIFAADECQVTTINITNNGTVQVEDGAIFNKSMWDNASNSTFRGLIEAYCTANSYTIEPWAYGSTEQVKIFAVAPTHEVKIVETGIEYPTLAAAIAAVQNGRTIEALATFASYSSVSVGISTPLSFTFKGNDLELDADFTLYAGSTLTLKDVTLKPTAGSQCVSLANNSILNLSNAHLVGRSGKSAVKVSSSATATLNLVDNTSNSIKNTKGNDYSYTFSGGNATTSVLNIEGTGTLLAENKGTRDGTTNEKTGYLFYKGEFNLNAANATYTYEAANRHENNATVTCNAGLYTVVIPSYIEDGKTVYPVSNYSQIVYALSLAQDGDIIRLTCDEPQIVINTTAAPIVINKSITLDFNGITLVSKIANVLTIGENASSTNTVTFAAPASWAHPGGVEATSDVTSNGLIKVNSNLVVNAGVYEREYAWEYNVGPILDLQPSAKATINGGTFKGHKMVINSIADATHATSLTINDGTFTAKYTNYTGQSSIIQMAGNTGEGDAYADTVTINGGTFSGAYSAINVFGKGAVLNVAGGTVGGNAVAIAGNGTANCGGTEINISGGTIGLETTPVGIYHPQAGELNISGGTVTGLTAVAMKSGALAMTDGILRSTGEGTRVPGYNNGTYASAAALQIESNPSYAGEMEINISGGKLESNSWYAVYEYTPEAQNQTLATEVNSIAISGGAHIGGILISQSLAATGGFVSGGKWSKDITANVVKGKVANPIDEDPYFFEVGDPTSATAEIVNDPSKNAVLTNEDGETYASTYTSEAVGDDAEVKTTTANNQVVVSENTDVVVDDTDENNSTIVEVKKVTVEGDAELNIKEGATLIVGSGSVLLDESTTTGGLTVEAGAALVVDGLVYGATEDNFVIEGQEEKSGIVLFSPETEFVKEDHPTATYRFTSKSFRDGSKWVYQRFGMPSFDGNVTVKSGNLEKNSYICTWDYAADDWGAWSPKIPAAGLVYANAEKAVPFQCYQLGSTNDKEHPITYDFIVELMGNANYPLNFKAGWNPYANSYTAPIDIKEFLTDVIANTSADIQATIYLYKDLGNDTYTWQGINLGNVGKTYRVRENGAMVKKTYDASIEPMQAFIMKLSSGDDATTDINYLNNVYNPAMGIDRPAAAPARYHASYNEMQIGAYNDMYWDNISVMEGEQFSAAEDNGYDACKYDHNRGLSLYVINGEQHMERMATDNADGMFIGINAPVAGTYTLDFSGIEGMNYSLIDMTNNTVVEIVEDGQYNFYAEAGQNDYRFQLVAPARVPTAIENVNAKASAKGVYSISGQYLGEDINALPKGVYIINGAKVVK